jgi:hypothetical protein
MYKREAINLLSHTELESPTVFEDTEGKGEGERPTKGSQHTITEDITTPAGTQEVTLNTTKLSQKERDVIEDFVI